MRALAPLLLFACAGQALSQDLMAEQIMERVAENQDRSVELRKRYVFRQRTRVRITKGADKLKREETRYYMVAPTPEGLDRELVDVEVIHRKDGEELELMGVGALSAEEIDGIDADLAEEFQEELGGDHKSRDGLNPELFPLTSRQQEGYRFALDGTESYRGRETYRVRFEPVKKDFDGEAWRGEALIDTEALQPVVVTSELAWKVPLWVRMVFGVNIRQLGFKVTYQEFDGGVWFPVSYGGEFRIKALHFFHRRAAVSLVNTNFQRTEVESTVRFAR